MSGIFSIMSDGQAGLFRLQQARRAAGTASPGETGAATARADAGAATVSDGTRHLSDLLAQGSSDPLTDFMRGASAALTALDQARRVDMPKARAEERLQQAERRIKELRTEMRIAAARGDREAVMKLAREAAALAKQAGTAAKEYGRGIAASADMGLGGGAAGLSVQSQTTTSIGATTVQASQTTVTATLTAGTVGAASAAESSPVSAEAPAVPPIADAGAGAGGTPAADAAQQPQDGGGGLASAINAALSAIGAVGAGGGAGGGGAAGQGSATANPFQAQMDGNAQRAARVREADTFARRVETVLAAVKNVLGEAKASNAYDPDQARRNSRREELKEHDKVVAEADKAVSELRSAAFGTPGGGTAAGGVAVAAPVAAAGSVNLVT